MREIKFRAWDERNKIMHYDFEFIRSGTDNNDWIVFKSNKQRLDDKQAVLHPLENPYFQQQLKIMQFTGLKDRNKVEIYEGDIVKVYDWGVKTSENIIGVSEIYWDYDDKGWNINPSHGIDDRYDLFRNIKIIGNIYENPELLNPERS